MWGIWLTWDEYKPCFPGTDQHDPSIGKWVRAGGAFATDDGIPSLFSCYANALVESERTRQARRHAHPPFTSITPKRYGPTSAGERVGCNRPDLSGLGGWMSP